MKYNKQIFLKNDKTAIIRNGEASDAEAVLGVFNQTHAETDFLLSYPDEGGFTVEQEIEYLKNKMESEGGIELAAIVDGKIVGTAGIDAIGTKYKLCHRAEFGIGILKEYWGLGIGKALTEACIECAKTAGYEQLELEVVADNESAMSMYKKLGFVEFGRNPKGFKSRYSGYQELIHMRLALK